MIYGCKFVYNLQWFIISVGDLMLSCCAGLAAKRAKMRKQQKRSDFALIDTTDDIPPEEGELCDLQ